MPSLNLPVPTVTPGPAWAQMVNVALQRLATESQSRAQGVPQFVSGRWYGSGQVAGVTAAASTLNTLYLTPFWVPMDVTVDQIACEVTALIASGTTRLGIYAASTNNQGQPDALVRDAGTVATDTTGVKTITINQALTTGLYYLGAVNQGAAATLRCITGDLQPVNWTAFDGGTMPCAYVRTGVTGALPATFTPTGIGPTAPRVQVRAF